MDRKRARELSDVRPGAASPRAAAFGDRAAPVRRQSHRGWARRGDRRELPNGCAPVESAQCPGGRAAAERIDHRDLVLRWPRPTASHRSPRHRRTRTGAGGLDFAGSRTCSCSARPVRQDRVLRILCREIIRTNTADSAQLVVVDFRRSLLGVVESEHLAGYATSPAALASRLAAILDRLEARMPGADVTQQQLRARSWWTGPEIYVVIDDYDLVAGQRATRWRRCSTSCRTPRISDCNRRGAALRRRRARDVRSGSGAAARTRVHGLDDERRPDEGVLLGSVRPSPLPPGRGTLITRGDVGHLIQVAWSDPP